MHKKCNLLYQDYRVECNTIVSCSGSQTARYCGIYTIFRATIQQFPQVVINKVQSNLG